MNETSVFQSFLRRTAFTRIFSALLLVLLGLRATPMAFAEEIEHDSPSPNGAFIFRKTFEEGGRKVELVNKKTEEVLLLVAESEEGSNRLYFEAFWAKDSKRFACTISNSRFGASVAVYERDGETFREVELPELPEPKLPEKLESGGRFTHWLNINYWGVVAWGKDGSLLVRGTTSADGSGGTATATITATLASDKQGAWKIRSQKKALAITKQ